MTGGAAATAEEREAIGRALAEIACAAGVLLMARHGRDCPHSFKADGSPASLADLEAEALILEALARRFPGIPVVAEESGRTGPPAPRFFLVDPLDGTRDFLSGTPDYAVSIGLIEEARPVAAAIAAPGHGRVWHAGTRAWEAPIAGAEPGPATRARTRTASALGLVAVGSRRHGDPDSTACLATLPVIERRSIGSAVKFGLIASGEADVYVRCGPTMEWDTAAGDLIVTAAGGLVLSVDGGPMRYGRADRHYRNDAFAAFGDPEAAAGFALRGGTAAA